MECIKGGKQAHDEVSLLKLQPPMQNVEDIKQAEAINQFTPTELCTPLSKEFCSNDKLKEHKNERLAYHRNSRRSLQKKLDKCMPGQPDKESKTNPIIQPKIKFHDI
jgi:kinesin family protein C1